MAKATEEKKTGQVTFKLEDEQLFAELVRIAALRSKSEGKKVSHHQLAKLMVIDSIARADAGEVKTEPANPPTGGLSDTDIGTLAGAVTDMTMNTIHELDQLANKHASKTLDEIKELRRSVAVVMFNMLVMLGRQPRETAEAVVLKALKVELPGG
jgi:hypothetical protein